MPPPRKKRKAPAPAAPPPPPRRPPSPSRLEFRSPADGAWYEARVTVQGGALRVMYELFTEEQDEWYDPRAAAAAPLDAAALRARFRAPSTPLDDARCRDLRPGDPLCVACALAGGVELKFFDAVLESVSPAAHETVDGEERCACRFSVRWAEGPLAGAMAEVGVEQVCCVRSTTPVRDPVLAEFLDGVLSKSPGDDGEGNATAASRSSGAVAP
ncbi:uncharacterized protein LOC127775075 [Oryza glaberrima]|uniref:SAWADEE domain-containing protein n=1 Tax=Oryza glaberrima TaxID=4538 RepID=I1PV77_ORYGL|nr:uncharacterized protein LOC127775075 [Oryza glaberrima]